MKWGIRISHDAKNDLKEIYKYIRGNKGNASAAEKIYKEVLNKIRTLEEMPYRNPKYEEEPWYSKGLRFVKIGKYLVFYFPDEDNNQVLIYRIIYSGRNVKKKLDRMLFWACA